MLVLCCCLSGPLLKRDLLKRKFDDETVEPWVRCNGCDKWLHQICALYNPSNPQREREWPGGSPGPNGVPKSEGSKPPRFYCPLCKLRSYSSRPAPPPPPPASSYVPPPPPKLLEGPAHQHPHHHLSGLSMPPLLLSVYPVDAPPPLPPLPGDPPAAPAPRLPLSSSSSSMSSAFSSHAEHTLPSASSSHMLPPGASPPPMVTPSASPSSASSASSHASLGHSSVESGGATAAGGGGESRRLWCAESLPETHMSRFIQSMVRGLLTSLGEHEASAAVTVRVVSSIERYFDVHRTVRSCFALDGKKPPTSQPDACLWSLITQRLPLSP